MVLHDYAMFKYIAMFGGFWVIWHNGVVIFAFADYALDCPHILNLLLTCSHPLSYGGLGANGGIRTRTPFGIVYSKRRVCLIVPPRSQVLHSRDFAVPETLALVSDIRSGFFWCVLTADATATERVSVL